VDVGELELPENGVNDEDSVNEVVELVRVNKKVVLLVTVDDVEERRLVFCVVETGREQMPKFS
jgi:hypothetical protein